MKIAVFDSGHGGLDILDILGRMHPDWELFYMADMAFMPYGNKELDTIIERCSCITENFLRENVDAMVVACNTATAMAVNQLRHSFSLPIIGIEPYVNYINHTENRDLLAHKVGALVTPNTSNSQRFKDLVKRIDPQGLVHVHASEELAQIIEELIASRDREVFLHKLSALLDPLKDYGWKEVILGCTHYPLVAKDIENILKVRTISPSLSVVQQLHKVLGIEKIGQAQSSFESFTFSYLNTAHQDFGQWEKRKIEDILFWRSASIV